MPVKYLGDKTLLYLRDYDDELRGEVVGICNRNLEMERVREWIERTTMDGEEVRHVKGLKRGKLEFNGLSMFPVGDEEDTSFFDETIRVWFEAGTRLYAKWVTDLGDGNTRTIDFWAVIQRWRPVRNNKEVANYDMTLLWDGEITAPTCPVSLTTSYEIVQIPNPEGDNPFWVYYLSLNYGFAMQPLVDEYVVSLYADNILVESQTKIPNNIPISGTFNNLDPDVAYEIRITVDGQRVVTCNPYSVAAYVITCPDPEPVITFGSNFANIIIPYGADIASVTVQFNDGGGLIDQSDYFIPYGEGAGELNLTYNGLDPLTAYNFVVVYNSYLSGYSIECGPYEFTTTDDTAVNFEVQNNYADGNVVDIDNPALTGLIGTFPLSAVGTVFGVHAGFTGQVQVDVTVGSPPSASRLELYKNNVFVEPIDDITTAGVKSFTSDTYVVGDYIKVVYMAMPVYYSYFVKLGGIGDVCGASPEIVYSSSPLFVDGIILYTSIQLDTPVPQAYASYNDLVYPLTAGVVGTSIGAC